MSVEPPREFRISGDFIELFKLLKASGLAETGGAAKLAVSAGAVKVDGETETRKGRKILRGQSVEFSGLKVVVA